LLIVAAKNRQKQAKTGKNRQKFGEEFSATHENNREEEDVTFERLFSYSLSSKQSRETVSVISRALNSTSTIASEQIEGKNYEARE
jgi:hypothetical protein